MQATHCKKLNRFRNLCKGTVEIGIHAHVDNEKHAEQALAHQREDEVGNFAKGVVIGAVIAQQQDELSRSKAREDARLPKHNLPRRLVIGDAQHFVGLVG